MRNTITTSLKPVAVAALLTMGMGGIAHAGETVDLGDGLKFDWRLNANYTLGTRVKSPDALLSSATKNANGNDGTNNFKKGAITANRLAALFESKLSKGSSGLVFTASSFYDDAYQGRNDNNGASTNPNAVNSKAPFDHFNSWTERYHGGYTRLLDTYAYTGFDIGQTRATVRVGRHVVNWGESSFFANISAAQGPFDGTKSGIPGTEVKEAILPEDQISGSLELTPELTLLGHAQFGFHETIAPGVGSFLSTSDVTGPGSSCLGPYTATGVCRGVNKGNDIRPGKTGQWGIGSRYRVTNETEVGLYYLNYNDRTPMVAVKPDYSAYQIRYFDDIKLLGTTVSTSFGKVSAYGEFTYRKGAPALVGAASTAVRANIMQGNIGGFYNIGRTPMADDMQFLAELSAVRINSVDGYSTNDLSFKTRNGLAFSGTWILSYPGFIEGWDMTVPMSYSRQLRGRTLAGGVGGEGDSRYSIGVNFVRKSALTIGVTYLGYLGDASLDSKKYRGMVDRDQLSINLKYSF